MCAVAIEACRRRARFRHARQHQAGGDQGDRERQDPKYTAVDGIPELKEAIAAKFKRENGLDYKPSQIIGRHRRQAGALQRLMATLNPGDEVIIPAPYWVSYPDMVLLAGGEPVAVPTTHRGRLQADAGGARAGDHAEDQVADLQLAVEPDRRRLYTRAELKALTDVLVEAPARLGADRRHVRAPGLRRLRVLDAGAGRAAALRAHADDERRVEGLLHDRLAHRLCRRSRAADQGDGDDPVAIDLEPVVDLAMGGGRGAERPAGLHRQAQQGSSRSAATSWCRC